MYTVLSIFLKTFQVTVKISEEERVGKYNAQRAQ